MASDVISVLEKEHRQVEDLLTRLQAGGDGAATLLDQVGAELLAHSRGEEDVVYPAIRKIAPYCAEQIDRSEEDHEKVENLLTQLRRTGPGGEGFAELVGELATAVEAHVEEEETRVLRAFRLAADERTLAELATEFQDRRQREMRTEPAAAAYPAEQPSAGRTSAEQMSKAELYERAKALDIPGRSSMTKEELARAVGGR